MLKVHREGMGVAASIRATSPRPRSSRSRLCAQAPASAAVRDGGNVEHDRPGTRSQPAHGFVEARQKRHEFITVEHLLLALLDNPTAAEVLRACGANMDELRKNLTQHITEQTPRIAADREVDTQPTLGFQRVIQRAILHVQSSGKKEVTGANVLVAIFGEKDSHAVYFLQQQGITRLDVVNYISHGITKTPQPHQGKGDAGGRAGERGRDRQQPARQLHRRT